MASNEWNSESLNNTYESKFGSVFVEAVSHAIRSSKYNLIPKIEQMEAMFQLSKGNDVFVKLSTGFGKSLIYSLFPFICDFFRGGDKSIVVLISPLISLMEDQIKSLKDNGIPAAKLSDALDFERYKILLLSPESFESKEVKDKLKKIKENVVCVAVDEAHCIEQWGRDFRGAYNQLNEVRALLLPKVPMIALTATANARVMQYIINKLDMEGCQVVKSSSNRANIFYEVQQLHVKKYDDYDNLLEECFGRVIDRILQDEANAEKTLIFCKSTNDCATVFEYFECRLGQNIKVNNELCVNMYVKITDEETKKNIVHSITNSEGSLRVVICSSAFGMGVDCPDVREIIHFFSPSSLMQYCQESGRAGRDGQPSKATLLFSGREFGHYKAQLTKSSASRVQFNELEIMKDYCQNETMCRRFVLLKYLDSVAEAKKSCNSVKHQCCDICAVTCKCLSCACSTLTLQAGISEYEHVALNEADATADTLQVRFSDENKDFIVKSLHKYQQSLGSNSTDSIFSRDSTTGFTDVVIDQVIQHCEQLFTVEDVYKYVDVWFEEHAMAILDVLSKCSVT